MRSYPANLKLEAQNLRAKGLTYPEIRNRLNRFIPKGTLSSWFKHITPPLDYFEKMRSLTANNIWKAQTVNKLKLEARLQSLHNKNKGLVGYIDKNIGKLILATLYWCEGSKYPTTRSVKFGNSDPEMISLFITLLRSCYPLDESKFRLTVQCRADQDGAQLTTYWQKITGIPLIQHYSPRVDKRSIGKMTLKPRYKGVCVVEYFNTNIQCELQFLGEYLGSDQALTQVKNQIK